MAVPSTGHYFTGWTGAGRGDVNPLSFSVANANDVVGASFASLDAGQFALVVVPEGFGRVVVNPRANRYNSGQIVTLTAVPEENQGFLGWSGDAAVTANPVVVTMSQSRTITATFTKYPTLAVGTCLGNVNGDSVPLLLTGEAGAVFQMEFSDNLTTWMALGSVTNRWGTAQVHRPHGDEHSAAVLPGDGSVTDRKGRREQVSCKGLAEPTLFHADGLDSPPCPDQWTMTRQFLKRREGRITSLGIGGASSHLASLTG